MKQIRQSIFETNSSSCHTFTHFYKAGQNSVEEELKARGITDDNRVLEVDLSWGVDEDGDCSFMSKLNMVLCSIPDFYSVYGTTDDKDDFVYTEVTEEQFNKNEIVQFILKTLKEKYNIELSFKKTFYSYSKGKMSLERVHQTSDWGDPDESSLVFNDDFYNNKELIIDFITSPLYRMGVHEYYNG